MSDHGVLFLTLAEIGGVFVGFGALIAATRRAEFERAQLERIRAVVTIGLVVVVASLVPIGLGSYGLGDRPLWFISSLVFLILQWSVILLSLRSRGARTVLADTTRASPLTAAFFWLALELPVQVPLILTLFGRFPAREPAFYTTSLVFNLFQAAFILAQVVTTQSGPENRP